MQIGAADISKISHIPSANDYNKLVDIINVVRKINLGPNMNGSINAAGISLDASPKSISSTSLGFPYGDKWAYGIVITPSDSDTIVNIYNPMVQINGVVTSNWLEIPPLSGTIPDKTYMTTTIGDSDWEDITGNGRVIIYHKRDTALNTETLEHTKILSDSMTLPTNDGGGTVDQLRYYLTPLYILSASRANGTSGNFINQTIYIDMIHGVQTPNIWG